jgi:hypothetical protein
MEFLFYLAVNISTIPKTLLKYRTLKLTYVRLPVTLVTERVEDIHRQTETIHLTETKN